MWNSHWLSTLILPLTYDNLHFLQNFEICEWATPHGAITERHKITFQNIFIHRSWPFPPQSGRLNPWQFSSDTWKLIFSIITWLHLKKTVLSFLNPALFPWICSLSLSSHCLAGISSEQCLELCITSTSCVYLLLYNVSLIVFLNCNSLWIKSSANWINVNVNE